MRIYVAAKFCDRLMVREVYKRLEENGHTVTVDWTNHEQDTDEDKRHWSEVDIQGIRDCDALIAVFIEERHQRGAMIEIGAALGLNKPVLIIGYSESTSTLLKHPLIERVGNTITGAMMSLNYLKMRGING